jgi:6-phospho-beta-glucosidase
MQKKIAVIGGGSAYAAGIVRTLVEHADLMAGSTLVLEDIRSEQQQTMLALARNLIRAKGADLKAEATLDLDEALEGADFVITCFRIGGYEALNLDVSIPAKYEMYGDETSGPGGIFFALRTVPVVVDIARRMERLCPRAFLVNYANPTGFVTDAVRRTSSIRELSLCSGFLGVARLVEQFLGLPADDVVPITAGVNHYTWLLHAYVGGRDVAPELLQKLVASDTSKSGWGWQRTVDIAAVYGLVPIPGGHMADYFYRREIVARHKEVRHWGLGRPAGRHSPVWKHYEDLAKAENPQFDMSIPGIDHLVGSVSDLAVDVVVSIAADRHKVFAVNLPNEGQITNLPRGEIVESSALVGAFGALPIAVGDLPARVLPMTEMLARSRRLAVDAALSGDKDTLLYALMSDPLVDSLVQVQPMMAEMLAAQAKWLPQFAR